MLLCVISNQPTVIAQGTSPSTAQRVVDGEKVPASLVNDAVHWWAIEVDGPARVDWEIQDLSGSEDNNYRLCGHEYADSGPGSEVCVPKEFDGAVVGRISVPAGSSGLMFAKVEGVGNNNGRYRIEATVDIPTLPNWSIGDFRAEEQDRSVQVFTFEVSLSGAVLQNAGVRWRTVNGSALAGVDYESASGSISRGSSGSETVRVTVRGDTDFEPDETFFVELHQASNSTISDSRGQGTITNNDSRELNFKMPEGTRAYKDGDPIVVTGKIVDSDGGGARNVAVGVRNGITLQSQDLRTTNENGDFSIRIPSSDTENLHGLNTLTFFSPDVANDVSVHVSIAKDDFDGKYFLVRDYTVGMGGLESPGSNALILTRYERGWFDIAIDEAARSIGLLRNAVREAVEEDLPEHPTFGAIAFLAGLCSLPEGSVAGPGGTVVVDGVECAVFFGAAASIIAEETLINLIQQYIDESDLPEAEKQRLTRQFEIVGNTFFGITGGVFGQGIVASFSLIELTKDTVDVFVELEGETLECSAYDRETGEWMIVTATPSGAVRTGTGGIPVESELTVTHLDSGLIQIDWKPDDLTLSLEASDTLNGPWVPVILTHGSRVPLIVDPKTGPRIVRVPGQSFADGPVFFRLRDLVPGEEIPIPNSN